MMHISLKTPGLFLDPMGIFAEDCGDSDPMRREKLHSQTFRTVAFPRSILLKTLPYIISFDLLKLFVVGSFSTKVISILLRMLEGPNPQWVQCGQQEYLGTQGGGALLWYTSLGLRILICNLMMIF